MVEPSNSASSFSTYVPRNHGPGHQRFATVQVNEREVLVRQSRRNIRDAMAGYDIIGRDLREAHRKVRNFDSFT